MANKYIKEKQEHEKVALIALLKGGAVTYDQLIAWGFPARRIKNYATDGYLKKYKDTVEVDGKKITRTWFHAGAAAKDWGKRNGICTQFQKGQSPVHCPKASEAVRDKVMAGVNPRDILNESEQRVYFKEEIDILKDKGIKFSVVDLVIVQGEQVEAIEIITENYDNVEKAKKNVYAKAIGATKGATMIMAEAGDSNAKK